MRRPNHRGIVAGLRTSRAALVTWLIRSRSVIAADTHPEVVNALDQKANRIGLFFSLDPVNHERVGCSKQDLEAARTSSRDHDFVAGEVELVGDSPGESVGNVFGGGLVKAGPSKCCAHKCGPLRRVEISRNFYKGAVKLGPYEAKG